MRVLKYRAWHKKVQRMYHVAMLIPDARTVMLQTGDGMFSATFDEIELQQFTGIFDKHGKEVFEGDIVKAMLHDNPEDWYKEVVEEVSVSDDGFLAPFYMRVFFEEDWWKDRLEDGFEIIGNIHQNNALLKQ